MDTVYIQVTNQILDMKILLPNRHKKVSHEQIKFSIEYIRRIITIKQQQISIQIERGKTEILINLQTSNESTHQTLNENFRFLMKIREGQITESLFNNIFQ